MYSVFSKCYSLYFTIVSAHIFCSVIVTLAYNCFLHWRVAIILPFSTVKKMLRKIAFQYSRATVLANLKTNVHLKLHSLEFLIIANAHNTKLQDVEISVPLSLIRYFQLLLAFKEFIPQNADQSLKYPVEQL